MSIPFLIIDGYNLMHATGIARRQYAPGDLERCRNQFINILSLAISEEQSARTIIVFDAFDAPSGLSRKYQIDGITILFAQPGHDADTVIEEMIEDHSSPRQVMVVSSDHRIQRAARKRRAQSIDSDLFLIELEKLAEKRKKRGEALPPQKLGNHITELETNYWLEQFGSIPTTMKDAGIEPLLIEIESEKKKSSSASQSPKSTSRNKPILGENENPETDEWLEIFNDVQSEFDKVNDPEFWQKQIDDVIKEETDP